MSEEAVSTQQIEQRMTEKIFGKPAATEKPAAEAKPAPQDTQGETEATAQADGAAGTTEAVEESYEFDFNGARYQVPKELKELHEGYIRTEDYTKKTMSAADKQRHAELLIDQAQKSQQLQSALQPKYEALSQTNQLLKSYEAVDWNTWIAQDPTAAQKGMLQWQVLKEQKARAEQELNSAAQEQMRAIGESRQKLVEENTKILQRDIKGWSADTSKKVNGWAEKTYGFSPEELSKVYDSRVVKMMNDAMRWHELQASKPQAEKKAAQVATLKPSATDTRNAAQVRQAELKKGIRTAKTDREKERAVQALLESRL